MLVILFVDLVGRLSSVQVVYSFWQLESPDSLCCSLVVGILQMSGLYINVVT
jgi:uncharacterized integral membrane protein